MPKNCTYSFYYYCLNNNMNNFCATAELQQRQQYQHGNDKMLHLHFCSFCSTISLQSSWDCLYRDIPLGAERLRYLFYAPKMHSTQIYSNIYGNFRYFSICVELPLRTTSSSSNNNNHNNNLDSYQLNLLSSKRNWHTHWRTKCSESLIREHYPCEEHIEKSKYSPQT